MSEDIDTLSFDFENTSDIILPPSPGIREVRFDEAPKVEPNQHSGKEGKLSWVARMKICDDLVPAERDRILMSFYDTKDQITQIKRVFMACGIQPTSATRSHELLGKTCKVRVTHSNVTKDGVTKVYANIQEFLVDASMIKNVPKVQNVGTVSDTKVPA